MERKFGEREGRGVKAECACESQAVMMLLNFLYYHHMRCTAFLVHDSLLVNVDKSHLKYSNYLVNPRRPAKSHLVELGTRPLFSTPPSLDYCPSNY